MVTGCNKLWNKWRLLLSIQHLIFLVLWNMIKLPNISNCIISVYYNIMFFFFSFYQNSSIHLWQTLMALGSDKTSVRFGVLTVVTIKINLFWDVMPCRQVDHYQCFREHCCATIFCAEEQSKQASGMLFSLSTLVNFY